MNLEEIDIIKITKRLKIIKDLISLEEEEDISCQLVKLKELKINDEVEEIITLINQQFYGKAAKLIESFIHKYSQVDSYIDPEIEALRFEAKALERQIQKVSNEKSELDKLIHEFNVRHNQELGELILKILHYQKEQSIDTPQFEEAEKDYNDFFSNYETSKDEKISTLSIEEQRELKNNFRKATKLCHPDVVDKEQKEEAHKIFVELNKAYEQNDLKRVSEILYNLRHGKAFTSGADKTNERLVLQQEIERLRIRLNELNEELNRIRTSDIFEEIINIKDWNVYFSQAKQRLQVQLDQFLNERK